MWVWKEIKKEGSFLHNKTVFSVENGKRVRFWKDIWCGNVALCDSFLIGNVALCDSFPCMLLRLQKRHGQWSSGVQ